MEFIAQMQDDPTERRRLQNRIAQRKFRRECWMSSLEDCQLPPC
jgi:hypothetical protein